MNNLLNIENLNVKVDDKHILKNLDLKIENGQIHAIMGPNGSGKSTLAYTLMGHPKYKIESGNISFENKIINNLPVDQRSKLGLFLALQYPYEIEGVTLQDFLRQSYNTHYQNSDKKLNAKGFSDLLNEKMKLLEIEESFVKRYLNVGFSGGEKKLTETLQLAVLQPKLAILDELDSGLDVDALKKACKAINKIKKDNTGMALLVITHYNRILKYLEPNFVHIMKNGKITKSGNKDLAFEIENKGYLEK